MNIDEIRTPAFLIDLPQLEHNASVMLQKAKRLNVSLRPHVKTHKTVEIARLQLGAQKGPITVSTLAEAEFFARAGFDDITYAVPISPDKLVAAMELSQQINRFSVLLDSREVCRAAEEFCAARRARLSVFLKVDCGYHRAGVNPETIDSLRFALDLGCSPHLRFEGILTHAGHAYKATCRDEIAAVAREEQEVMSRFAEKLRREGGVCSEVSIGSTPTAAVADEFKGVSEIRPGNYCFFDKFQAEIGSCAFTDCAVGILSRIIGSYPERGKLICDAGALALSRDPGAVHVTGQQRFGSVVGFPELEVTSLSQEHGVIEMGHPEAGAGLGIGSLIRIIPNHSCLAAALFDRYRVCRGDEVIDEWLPARGW